MPSFAILLRSYGADLSLASRLLDSFEAHNPDGLNLFCVVPTEDIAKFAPLAREHVTVMGDEPFSEYFVRETMAGVRSGYINQEIVKLAFHELGVAENYFCVDSDAVFIRDVHERDFVAPDGYPYTVLVEDNELKIEPRYYNEHWQGREQTLRDIAELIGLNDDVIRTCHGHQTFSSTVLRSFVSDFLQPRGWTYKDALARGPYEFTWYNFWLQKSQCIPIHQREPLVKVFHNASQHQEYVLRGIREEDIARGYLALVVNSNFSRDLELPSLAAGKPESLAPYLSYQELARIGTLKLKDTWRRRTNRKE